MTDRDIKVRAVASRFLGWEPGRYIDGCVDKCPHRKWAGTHHRVAWIEPEELPPPDPRDPAVRVALEDALLNAGWTVSYMPEGRWIYAQVSQAKIRRVARNATADDALLEAAYQVVTASPQP